MAGLEEFTDLRKNIEGEEPGFDDSQESIKNIRPISKG
jgi:hypothetical protein